MAIYKPFKDPNVQVLYTPAMLSELKKCTNDPIYFMKNFVKIQTEGGAKLFEPYYYQEEMIQGFNDNKNVIALCGRQLGKCFLGDSLVSIRNKYTGEVKKITIEEFRKLASKK